MRTKRPTRAQKIIISRWHLNPDNWRIIKELPYQLQIEHKHTGTRRTIPEGPKGRQELQEVV